MFEWFVAAFFGVRIFQDNNSISIAQAGTIISQRKCTEIPKGTPLPATSARHGAIDSRIRVVVEER